MSLDQFKEDLARDYEASHEQRDAANEDMRFVMVDGGQWEGWLEEEDRTKMEFDITSDYVDRFVGREELSDIGVKFEPGMGEGSDEDAELLSGLYMHDYATADGEISTLTAKREAVTCGVGAFRFTVAPVDDEDPESPMRVGYKPVYSAHATVIWDCGATRQDKADARHVSVLVPFSRKGFKRAYPEHEPASLGMATTHRGQLQWATKDLVWVVERFHIERKRQKVMVFANPLTREKRQIDVADFAELEDELFEDGFEPIGAARTINQRRVMKTIFHGNGILEPTKRVPGKHLWVVPVYGKYGFVDGMEAYEGMVRGLKDPQRLFNLHISKSADDATDSHREIPFFTPEQMEGLDGQWGRDLNEVPYLLARPVKDENGSIVAPGAPQGFLPTRTIDQNAANMIQLTTSYMDRKTGALMGIDKDPDASGEAKREDRKELDISTAHYNKSIRMAMMRAGQVYMSIAQEIYADQRRVKVMKEDGTTSLVNLQEQVMDQERGLLVPRHDISRGAYDVIVKAGPQYESAREATVEMLKDVLTNLAQGNVYEGPVLATLMANLAGVGTDELREFAIKQQLLIGMREPETDEEKRFVQQAQASQQSEQDEVLRAVAMEQQTAAEENRANTIQKLSQADLNRAKTREINATVVDIQEGMKDRRMKLLMDSTQPLAG